MRRRNVLTRPRNFLEFCDARPIIPLFLLLSCLPFPYPLPILSIPTYNVPHPYIILCLRIHHPLPMLLLPHISYPFFHYPYIIPYLHFPFPSYQVIWCSRQHPHQPACSRPQIYLLLSHGSAVASALSGGRVRRRHR